MMKLLISTILMFTAFAASAEPMYVQSLKAKLMGEPSFRAEMLTELNKGDQVEALGKKGAWYQVKAGDKQGWVSRLLLKKRPPVDKVTYITGADEADLDKDSRRRASKVATAGAARGLSSEDRRRVSGETLSDFSSLHQMERIEMESSEVILFLQEGVGK
jgi:uncharacterized protein YgiM (DUF1202 family)